MKIAKLSKQRFEEAFKKGTSAKIKNDAEPLAENPADDSGAKSKDIP